MGMTDVIKEMSIRLQKPQLCILSCKELMAARGVGDSFAARIYRRSSSPI
jgi:hypothetical protein